MNLNILKNTQLGAFWRKCSSIIKESYKHIIQSIQSLFTPIPSVSDLSVAVRGPLTASYITIGVGVGGLIFWGTFAAIDSAIVAHGTLVVELNRRNIQHLEGGIVGRVLVRDGDSVVAGQPLIELDGTRVRAQLNVVRDEIDRLKARASVLNTEKAGINDLQFPQELSARRHEKSVSALLKLQEEEFIIRREALDGQTSILTQRIAQLQKQIYGLEIRVEATDRQLALIRQEIAGIEDLTKRGLERVSRLLALQRDEARLLGEKGEAIETIARTQQAISETELQRAQLVRTRQEDIAKELRDIQGRIQELTEREISASDQLTRLSIDAPESGTIMDLRFTTRGGVISPGALIASIVPQEERLLVEAQISPSDVSSLRVGMPASIRLINASGSLTPTLEGSVERISPDSMADPKTGAVYFTARIGVSSSEAEQKELKLQSGAQVDVLVRRGERTALSYFVRPIIDRFSKSLREY